MSVPLSRVCLGLFIVSGMKIEAMAIERPPAAGLNPPLIGPILTPLDIYIYFQFLKRYGTQKSNCQIKSYGSQKFGMQRLVCHPNFHDISTVLTLILNHE